MKTMKASEAKQNWGKLMDMVTMDPVHITKHDRPHAVIVSYLYYEELRAYVRRYNHECVQWDPKKLRVPYSLFDEKGESK
jgi:prevent-host-death family protein